jgi:hypothetical protein
MEIQLSLQVSYTHYRDLAEHTVSYKYYRDPTEPAGLE